MALIKVWHITDFGAEVILALIEVWLITDFGANRSLAHNTFWRQFFLALIEVWHIKLTFCLVPFFGAITFGKIVSATQN